MSFQTNKYQVIKSALSYELSNFALNYLLLKRDATRFMYENNIHSQSPILGTWTDQQIPNTYSCYGDFVMDTFCLLYTSPSPRDATLSRMPSSA